MSQLLVSKIVILIWQLFKSSSSKLQSKRDRFLFPTSGISQPSPLSCNYNRRNISDTQVNGMAHQASPNCSSLQDSWSKWELWNWVPRDAPLRVNHCTLPPVYLHIDHCTLPSVSLPSIIARALYHCTSDRWCTLKLTSTNPTLHIIVHHP